MAEPEITEMDVAVTRCLQQLGSATAGELTPCLADQYPGWDELEMRQGESITRLRGKGYLTIETDGRIQLTESGVDLAASED